MAVYRLDPVRDPRWSAFLQTHADASMFHTPGWLQALSRTYGYTPVVYTTSSPGQDVLNGIPFCRIESYLTGRRLVSLPFSDHCEPLVRNAEELAELLCAANEDATTARCKYFEIRPFTPKTMDLNKKDSVLVHKLDLREGKQEVFHNLHASSIRRKITRSEREGLTYEEGTSDNLLAKFYSMLLLTRRRHKLPPQPLVWFQNLIRYLGDALKIRIVSKGTTPAAGIITVSYKKVMTYKYGCSDPQFNALGGTVLLFWRAIQEAIDQGASEFDFGRSEYSHTGLITFKERWGAKQYGVSYYSNLVANGSSSSTALMTLIKHLSTVAPDPAFVALGRFLYRHAG